MGLSAGKLRHRITLQSKTITTDGYNKEVWKDYRSNVAAEVSFLSGNAVIASNAEHSKVVARIRIRFDAKINASMKIVFRNEVYAINAILPDNESGLQWLTLLVEKGAVE